MDELKESPDKVYEFYCTNPKCRNGTFRALRHNLHICCPVCSQEVILEKQLRKEHEREEEMRGFNAYLQKCLELKKITEAELQATEYNALLERYRYQYRDDTFDPEVRNKKQSDEDEDECDHSPKLELTRT